MKSDLDDLDRLQIENIKKITLKIIERYEIYDYQFAFKIAKTAYLNGIHLDKFKKEYYGAPFNLDEIIYYLIKKEMIQSKYIPFIEKNITHSPKEKPEEPTVIIPFPTEKGKNKKFK